MPLVWGLRSDACCDSKKHQCELFTYSEAEAPTLGCDPPIQLLDNALAAMKSIDPNTNYLVFTGDMVAHHLCSGTDQGRDGRAICV